MWQLWSKTILQTSLSFLTGIRRSSWPTPHFQERRDNQTGSALLTSCVEIWILVEFWVGPIKGLFFFPTPIWGFSSVRPVDSLSRFPFPLFLVFNFSERFFYACREKTVVTPNRLSSPRTLTRELQANQEGRKQRLGQCPACAFDFVCACFSFVGVVAQPKPWSTAPAVRGLSWTAFSSTCWTEPGTSSACSVASANVIWQRNVFLEKEDCTAKMIFLGKLGESGRKTHQLCFYL